MIAYWAILKDSFREALASRVLWVLLLTSSVVLAIIAGFGTEERAGASFTADDILDAPRLYSQLMSNTAALRAGPGKRIWSIADEETKADLAEVAASSESMAFGNPMATLLAGLLNRIVSRVDLYDSSAWRDVRLDAEARELINRGGANLSSEDLARLNRLLIEQAFPLEIAPSRNEELYVSYWGSPLGTPVPVRRDLVIKTSVYLFARIMVGMLGVFCAIIVTASIIPQTFEAGAVDLLLSKPISRPLLYLTKFVGGLTFTLINAAFILGGLWLIVGWRHGIWTAGLLWCIPIFVFVFAIYYSVSAFVGVVWRNTIVSVVATIVFWAVCWGLGAVKGLVIETFFIDPVRPIRLLTAGNDLIAANEQGLIVRWDGATEHWTEILVPDEARRWRPFSGGLPLAGPVYDEAGDRIVVVQKPTRRFSLMSSTVPLAMGSAAEHWRRREGIGVPQGTTLLEFDSNDKLLAVAQSGIFRQTGELINKTAGSTPGSIQILGLNVQLPFGAKAENAFTEVGPAMRLSHPFAAAVNSKNDEIAIYNREVLSVLAPDTAAGELPATGRYIERLRKEVPDNGIGVMAVAGDRIVLGNDKAAIQIYNSSDLRLLSRFEPAPGVSARFIEASPDARHFAVLLHDRSLWLYDATSDSLSAAKVDGQGEISTAVFDGPEHLLVADRTSRVTCYAFPQMTVDWRVEQSPDWLETTYRYLVRPLHTAFPKPTEVDSVVQFLLMDQRTRIAGPRDGDLRTRQVALDLWGPFWSSLAFIGVMLTMGCIYTQRKDF